MRTDTRFDYTRAELKRHWPLLHAGDREALPTAAAIEKLVKGHAEAQDAVVQHGGAAKVASALEEAWRAFHRGDFMQALKEGSRLGVPGVMVANKAAATQTLYVEHDARRRLSLLREAVERGEDAVKLLPDYANAHYALAMVMGRYSQRISILEALAEGLGGRIRTHLERVLKLQPKHAEAHIALGLYHAELVKTLGSLAARLTYGASTDEAIAHFRSAVKLAPKSVVARVEYVHGLKLLGGSEYEDQIEELREQAAALRPLDRLDELDFERLQRVSS